MKALAIPAAALAATFALVQPAAAADITLKPPPGLPGPEIRITAPGVPGRIDVGRLPQPPAVILPQPIVIQAPRAVAPQPPQPVYLWVPPGHRKDWRKHCGKYNACGAPVYFVRHDWYERNVMEPHRRGRGKHGDGEYGHGHRKGKGKGRD